MKTMGATDCDMVIVGAGPVGLLLANLLGAVGHRVIIIERRTAPPAHSHAIGITPPSLQILAKLGLDEVFIAQGLKIEEAIVHGETGRVGSVNFRTIPGDYRFILSLPQSLNVLLLERNLSRFASVTLHRGMEVLAVKQDRELVKVDFSGDASDGKLQSITASYVIACDGDKSSLREMLNIPTTHRTYPCHFLMGDFTDHSGLGEDAHLFFTAAGAVESFPLPQGKRRWIVQTDSPMKEASSGYLSAVVQQRTGFQLPPDEQLNQSAFTPRTHDSVRYHEGRVILCGDAAHVMSPIGGQGMNTGFADAEFIARALDAILHHEKAPARWLAAYERYRRLSAHSATRRAAWGMWFGTWRGKAASLLRDVILRHVLLNGPLSKRIAPHFAMISLPYNTLARVPLPSSSHEPPR